MNITIDQLRHIINSSIETMEVSIPDRDYYAKSGNITSTTINYIDPYKLIEELENLIE